MGKWVGGWDTWGKREKKEKEKRVKKRGKDGPRLKWNRADLRGRESVQTRGGCGFGERVRYWRLGGRKEGGKGGVMEQQKRVNTRMPTDDSRTLLLFFFWLWCKTFLLLLFTSFLLLLPATLCTACGRDSGGNNRRGWCGLTMVAVLVEHWNITLLIQRKLLQASGLLVGAGNRSGELLDGLGLEWGDWAL